MRVRSLLRKFYLQQIVRRGTPIKTAGPGDTVLVFSPHQDDETLGCGGTILKQRQSGALVKVIFLADGASSHSHLVPAIELTQMREKEAIAACLKLGIEEKDVLFLRFPDGQLNQNYQTAVEKMVEILDRERPAQIFLPHHKEPTPDHIAAHAIVVAALEECPQEAEVFEYPVWYWQHWPWVSLVQENRRQTKDVIKNTIAATAGFGFLQAFHTVVDIRDVLDKKRAALAQHVSQMTRLNSNPAWLTLHDVYRGEFLPCFFQGYEVFHRLSFRPEKTGRSRKK